MRQVILDTETTGLEVKKGHRIIEIGCVELLERRPSGRTFHCYINPQRDVDEGARAVHGIDNEFLRDKPLFAEIAAEFLEFVDGSEVIAHNASFDVGFLDAELRLFNPQLGKLSERAKILDTLVLAREKYPGQKNNLDALCRRLGVDSRHRELHGALVDAWLLADVYLAMTSGQGDLGFSADINDKPRLVRNVEMATSVQLRVLRASGDELEAHERRIAAIDKASRGACVWRQLEAT